MNNLSSSYEKILETLQSIEQKMNFRRQHRQPRLSDLELIALSLTAEYLSIDSECQLLGSYPSRWER
jgi:7,8-dihydro-6-hydroxymethylpterin-pyrophosphokinase